ncbi:hypothetical protein BDN67DRAFT_469789 [Paxillus ammoniavirescens]|nr:hypothetical protein BDN67DRAFT_469789 [Paxillus ammoniavirescens]
MERYIDGIKTLSLSHPLLTPFPISSSPPRPLFSFLLLSISSAFVSIVRSGRQQRAHCCINVPSYSSPFYSAFHLPRNRF